MYLADVNFRTKYWQCTIKCIHVSLISDKTSFEYSQAALHVNEKFLQFRVTDIVCFPNHVKRILEDLKQIKLV